MTVLVVFSTTYNSSFSINRSKNFRKYRDYALADCRRLQFINESDYEKISLFDELELNDVKAEILNGDTVTIFNKKGVEIEQPPRDSQDANIRKNTILSRKYYLAALTDATKAVKITLGA